MRPRDRLEFCLATLRAQSLRSALTVLGVAIGVAAVVLLSSLGNGLRGYVSAQFAQFGTQLLQITPGHVETFGLPGALGGSTRPLTLADAEALARVRAVERVLPTVIGQGAVEGAGRSRDVYVIGTTSDAPAVWHFAVRRGAFLPDADPHRCGHSAALGPKLARELFGEREALGQWVRIAGTRLRVTGIMESKGSMLGFDFDDTAYVDLATGLALFDLRELSEIDVSFRAGAEPARVGADLRAALVERHGREDFTLLSQAAMLEVFDSVLAALTWVVAALGGISLIVGALGVLTVMGIAVGERTGEIGLLRAIGASRAEVRALFVLEALLLAAGGGLAGLALGLGGARALHLVVPELPIRTPAVWAWAALATSLCAGALAGLSPARRAAQLDPIEALRAD